MKKLLKNGVLLACSLFAINSHATIIGGSVTAGNGSFVELTIPFTESNPDNEVGNNTFQNNNLYAFNEGQNILINAALNVDDAGGGVAGTIAANTVVASHYVFFDPAGGTNQEGRVHFDSDILGIMTKTGTLAASDFLLNNGVTYRNPGARGLEGNDRAWFTGSTVFVDWRASTPGDYIRVLTAYSPAAEVSEASTFSMFLLGMFGMVMCRRRKS